METAAPCENPAMMILEAGIPLCTSFSIMAVTEIKMGGLD